MPTVFTGRGIVRRGHPRVWQVATVRYQCPTTTEPEVAPPQVTGSWQRPHVPSGEAERRVGVALDVSSRSVLQ